ncbi:hypothetical protein D3C72_2453600 [compost metagenome]
MAVADCTSAGRSPIITSKSAGLKLTPRIVTRSPALPAMGTTSVITGSDAVTVNIPAESTD